jgi:hypothetical protein
MQQEVIMMQQKDENFYIGFRQGYIAGYHAGAEHCRKGLLAKNLDNDITRMPIESMSVSTRAHNCLRLAGCKYVADVIMLDTITLSTMRKLGPKTAREIAQWLNGNNLSNTPWDLYL